MKLILLGELKLCAVIVLNVTLLMSVICLLYVEIS